VGDMDIRDQWCWQNFIMLMWDIKFWKGNENLRSVYKKPFFEILSGFFYFWPYQFSKKFIVPSKWWKLFFFELVKWGIKKSVFSYRFQKCTYDLCKKCTQKKL
jgi:hypothetical protein